MYDEKYIQIKQARLDRSCLLVSLECTDRHHSPSADDLEGGLSVRQISASTFRVGRCSEIFACHYNRQRSELLVIRFVIMKILIDIN